MAASWNYRGHLGSQPIDAGLDPVQIFPVRGSTKILVAESHDFPARADNLLRLAGDLILADLDRESLLSAVRSADILWVRLRNRIDAEVIAAGRNLKIIVTPTTGLNHIDVEETQRRGIRVLSLRGETQFLQDVRATAEHTLGLMLSLLRQIPRAVDHVRNGHWDRDLFKGRELYGKTVGVVGYGRLGRIVSRYLKAFDVQMIVSDPHVDSRSIEPGVILAPLPQLLRASDLVTLHINLCDATKNWFGEEQFAAMKRESWFINTSRGEVIDDKALLSALRSGHLAGAALDVLAGETSGRMHEHALVAYAREHNNLIITPHLGGCTTESMEKAECFLAQRLLARLGRDEATKTETLPSQNILS